MAKQIDYQFDDDGTWMRASCPRDDAADETDIGDLPELIKRADLEARKTLGRCHRVRDPAGVDLLEYRPLEPGARTPRGQLSLAAL